MRPAESSVDRAVHDPARVSAVRALGLLDKPPDDDLDRLTRVAAGVLDTPIALLTLVDADRDFYLSSYGLAGPLAVSRELFGRTFCHYVVEANGEVQIGDTGASPECALVPTVTSLGVVSLEARTWTQVQLDMLRDLAALAQSYIHHRVAVTAATRLSEVSDQALLERENALAAMVHDIRNPLNAIVTAAELFRHNITKTAAASASELILRNGHQMKDLLNELADASLFEQGNLKLRSDPTDVIELSRAAVLMMAHRANRRGIQLLVRAAQPKLIANADSAVSCGFSPISLATRSNSRIAAPRSRYICSETALV